MSPPGLRIYGVASAMKMVKFRKMAFKQYLVNIADGLSPLIGVKSAHHEDHDHDIHGSRDDVRRRSSRRSHVPDGGLNRSGRRRKVNGVILNFID